MNSMARYLSRVVRCTSGSATVEMALIMPIMISLMVGGVDFGMAFSAHATMGKSVRNAARYLGSLPKAAACSSWAIANAKNLAVFGKVSPGAGDSALVSGWRTNGGTEKKSRVSLLHPPTVFFFEQNPFWRAC